jgi:Cu(I)/Ag(I) efflux system protein CusF
MKQRFAFALLATAFAAAAWAQTQPEAHAAHHPASAAAADDMTDGEVRKVDKGTAKITIRHAEIKRLDMPPMTMVFQVKEAALLDKVKAGDKIRFSAEQSSSGFVVTAIRPAP